MKDKIKAVLIPALFVISCVLCRLVPPPYRYLLPFLFLFVFLWFHDRYKYWSVIHNLVAHPLIAFYDGGWFARFHDWTADKMFAETMKDLPPNGMRLCVLCDDAYPIAEMKPMGSGFMCEDCCNDDNK